MTHRFADIIFTSNVKAAQDQYGSRASNERLQSNFGPNDRLTQRETDFIKLRDSFYISTVSETGWPYVQHRGGPRGFLKVLGPHQLAYADFRGNTQLITTGNVSSNNRCSMILMDYPNQRRLKVLGRMAIFDSRMGDGIALEKVVLPDYKARIERVVVIDIIALDWNCPQHIVPRYTADDLADAKGQSVLKTDFTHKGSP